MVPITEPKPRDAGGRREAASDDKSTVVALSAAATAAASGGRPGGVTARIAAIRELLATDAYPIDFDQLASRIVDDEIGRQGT